MTGRALVVLLGAAADLAGLGDVDKPGFAEDFEVVGHIALLRVELRRKPAGGGRPVAEGEEQPLTQRVGERRELLGRTNLQDFLRRRQVGTLITHTKVSKLFDAFARAVLYSLP
ncbi:hypothetical protein GCM10010388_51210 [Streptomyces mauvecolor]